MSKKITTSGNPDNRKKGKHTYSFDKEDYPKISQHLERVHYPKNETEKEHLRTMMLKVYDAEHQYQTGKITRNERDEKIEVAEEEYDRGSS